MSGQRTQDTPMAIDLANWLESVSTGLSANQAATELRRLHAEVERLMAQRDGLLAAMKHIEGVAMADEWRDLPEIAKHARAVIAKAEGGAA